MAVGITLAVTAPTLARDVAEQLGQPCSGAFTDVVRGAIPVLAAMPLLRRGVRVLPAGIWILAVIGWRLPVIRHPDWEHRPPDAASETMNSCSGHPGYPTQGT